ncbi:chemotaxis response regulator protein-glutamate methylesterase [Neptuniibacter sp. 2_MG-2023]|uniref:protein-glutamate methylesterase/protein-glutamine glutaminase n=1 Tax=Neptuniibacter sp. 2_MG-2023 TaxID=3062671 RepID=UPI0026E3EDE9|nr:chemotaxis response regulator protein-glutamate methylesterase [Neptuniibacter sp. 2_MG-2023]MDO6514561.1 chemotaxis response regulator protein-glutamate methylesterase [Neptuniibacter sp. 2_MG-2023]
MPVKVLIVDDSGFFRHRISDLLSGDCRIEVVGTAKNGKEAIEQAKALRPNLITMDVEMPQMNGIEAVRVIMRECPTNILMLSSLTSEGARVTIQALEAGALDYLSKDMRAWMAHSGSLEKQLRDKVVALGRSRHAGLRNRFSDPSASSSRVFKSEPVSTLKTSLDVTSPRSPTSSNRFASNSAQAGQTKETAKTAPRPSQSAYGKKVVPDCRVVVIGSSTGGPAALQQILTQIPANFPHPILLVQHMPKAFTSVFATRLDQQCDIAVKEAEDGDFLKPGRALLAPGGCQMIIDPRSTDKIKIMPGDDRLTYKPSVDVTYASVAKSFGKKVLAIILTGMGADGCDGARMLRQQGATIWAQNKESCTIYGMPQAVINAGLADAVFDLTELVSILGSKRP